MPDLSVIVPVYKVEQYLDACVGSILAQTLRDLELILVDDGSPDTCGAMCDAWAKKDERVRVIHKENSGVSSARNAGLAAAAGEYVAFVDSDDTIEPETYAACLSAAREGRRQVVCYGYRVVTGDAVDCYTMPAFAIDTIAGLRPHFMEYTSTAALFGSACNKVYLRALLSENGIRFDESILSNEDEPFNFAVLRHCQRMAFLPPCFYHYMMRENASITRKGSVDVFHTGQTTEKYAAAFFDAVPELADLKEEYLEGRRQRALFNHYNQLTGRNALTFGQRRAALRDITGSTVQRQSLLARLEGERGLGAAVSRIGVRLRLPGLLAAAACLRNAMPRRQ